MTAVRQRPRTPGNSQYSFAFVESFLWHFKKKNSVQRWSSDSQGLFSVKSGKWHWEAMISPRTLNPLSAKPSFQLWYPGGQRLKVISFSWSWVKSPSKCFSNTEPTTIIASRDEKRCNAPRPLSSEPDWCTQVRYASVINTGNVTDDCFSSLSPRSCHCSLTVLQLCTSTSTKTAKCETVATSGLGNRLLKTRWFLDDERSTLRTITRWLPCVFFSLLDHGSLHTTRTNRDDDRWYFCMRSIWPTPGSRVFIPVFDVPCPKCFAQSWDRHSCQASKTGSALEKRKKISTNTCSQSSQKRLATERSFQKEPQNIVQTKSPRAWTFGAKFFKSAGNRKTLRKGYNSGKKWDNFELRTKIVLR